MGADSSGSVGLTRCRRCCCWSISFWDPLKLSVRSCNTRLTLDMWHIIEFIISILTFRDPRKLMRGEMDKETTEQKKNGN
jgi:hypothetical protein